MDTRTRTELWKLRNRLHSLLLLLCLLVLAALLAWLVLGSAAVPWLVAVTLAGMLSAASVPRELVLRLSGARPLHLAEAPGLHAVLGALSQRAGLPRPPALYVLPRGLLNAFSVGRRDDAAVVVTAGLFRTLGPEEIVAVLAHEVAHVAHDDMQVMLLADLAARITGSLAAAGALLLALNLPRAAGGELLVSWAVVAVLMAAPTVTGLLQLALSRSREREADLEAVRLTGNPRALASALRKIDGHRESWLERLVLRRRHGAEPAWLRTHPTTEERIRTLLALEGSGAGAPALREEDLVRALRGTPAPRRGRAWFVR